MKIKVNISKIVFRAKDSNYKIMKCNLIKNENKVQKLPKKITLKGYFPTCYEGDILYGEVTLDKNKNWQGDTVLRVKDKAMKIIKPADKNSYIKYLINRTNITRKDANKLFDAYGFDTLKLIKADMQNIMKVGIPENKAFGIYNHIHNQEVLDKLCLYIKNVELPIKIAFQIFEKYESLSMDIIKDNPYQICYDGEISFKVAEIIGKKERVAKSNIKRVTSAILAFMRRTCESNGHVCYPKELITANTINKFCNSIGIIKDNKIKQSIIDACISILISDGRLKEDNEYLYLARYHMMENTIVEKIKRMFDWIPPFCNEQEISDFLVEYEKNNYPLDEKQKDAVYKALLGKDKGTTKKSCRLSVITGGPGTGKTSTTNVITEAILSISKARGQKVSIDLVAPSGKAAQRMIEVSSMMTESSTIHRKYKIGFHRGNQDNLELIADDFVFIDEVSMLDIEMMYEIVKKSSEDTRFIFSGDVDQLPSVGPGQILKDLINSGIIPTTKLTTIFRQAQDSDIVKVAHAVNNGESSIDMQLPFKKGTNFVFWETNSTEQIQKNLLASIKQLQNLKFSMDNISILAPMKKGDIGVNESNVILQKEFGKKPNHSAIKEYIYENPTTGEITHFRKGDKVIHIKNDYDIYAEDLETKEIVEGVYNGFVGVISYIYEVVDNGQVKKEMEVIYENQNIKVKYTEKEMEELELAYAITVHKSQGSEYEAVIMPIHMSQKILLNRKLLYTAITRAKKMFILIGSREALDYAIQNTDCGNRYSQLEAKLKSITI